MGYGSSRPRTRAASDSSPSRSCSRSSPDAARQGTFPLREGAGCRHIEHDHVITIHQVGEDRGIPFIAMSFLKGMSLDDWLKQKRPLAMPQILRIGRETAKGLAAAHERGLIHRDIKPANLWLDGSTKGRIKILDFGLARAEKEDVALTRSGQIIGTPQYMSPEQAAGEKLDARSDLFSLGVVLYPALHRDAAVPRRQRDGRAHGPGDARAAAGSCR